MDIKQSLNNLINTDFNDANLNEMRPIKVNKACSGVTMSFDKNAPAFRLNTFADITQSLPVAEVEPIEVIVRIPMSYGTAAKLNMDYDKYKSRLYALVTAALSNLVDEGINLDKYKLTMLLPGKIPEYVIESQETAGYELRIYGKHVGLEFNLDPKTAFSR